MLSLFLLLMMILCCGCASGKGELFSAPDPPVLWPAPPEKPRIKYLGQLAGEEDLKAGVSFAESFGRFIFGRDDVGVLVGPRGMVLDDSERMYIADSSGAVVHMMDLQKRRYRQFFKLGGGTRLLSPIDVVAVDDAVYVSDSVLQKICVFDRKGNYKSSFGAETLLRPSGMAYSHLQNKLYVADTKRHVISIFDSEGNWLRDLGGRGSGQGYFNFPTYLWLDTEDKLYVSDTLNYRVQVFSPEGKFLLTFGKHGNRPGYFAHPCGLATDSLGNIYVGDKQFENIQIFNSKGEILMAVGGEGHGPGQFWLPSSIFIDDKDRIFISDSFNKRIQVLQLLEAQTP